MSKIFVIHENDAWVEPLRAAFARLAPLMRNGSWMKACWT